jgi:hypothetical protein
LDVNLPGISARHAAKVIVDVEIDASKLHPTHVAMKVAIIAGHPPTRLPKISCSASRCRSSACSSMKSPSKPSSALPRGNFPGGSSTADR